MNEMIRREPLARAFVYTPAHVALESAARLFPVFRPQPLVVDEHPLMAPPGEGREAMARALKSDEPGPAAFAKLRKEGPILPRVSAGASEWSLQPERRPSGARPQREALGVGRQRTDRRASEH
jgi:hypothetical protein